MSDQTLQAPAGTFTERRSTNLNLEIVKRSPILSMLSDSFVLAKRGALRVPRQMDWLVGVTIMPIMFLLMFRYIFAGSVQATMPAGENAVNYLVVGILVQGIVFGGMNTALGLATDMKEGLMDRFRVLPMSRVAVLLGRILTDLGIAIFTSTITVVVALAVGFRPTGNVGDWLVAILLMLYAAFVMSWLGAAVGLWLKSIEAVNSVGFSLIFPITFVSSAFARPETMPSWLEGFAKNQPFTLIVDATRGLLTGYPDVGNKVWLALMYLTIVLVIMVPLSLWLHERRSSQ